MEFDYAVDAGVDYDVRVLRVSMVWLLMLESGNHLKPRATSRKLS